VATVIRANLRPEALATTLFVPIPSSKGLTHPDFDPRMLSVANAMSEESVLIDAKNLGIDASITAGRIRKERGNYKILNSLIGLREVALQFEKKNGNLV